MAIVGQFRDLDDADRFVWIRGFASMPARAQALASFYGGDRVLPALSAMITGAPQQRRLVPTARSLLR